MHFQRLKLTGFKSFVEATELRIEPGLTGIVGPNGCGKSNLLEALRWVMGANSAKAMRGEGMDDVIFGGSTARPARNHAEVALQIDNTERTAPERFNDAAVIEVVRRITRGAGSAYRVNGVEARARDVQMLFADASTGANSPALVRQGQVSELIAAKPANRRRILEEAAGVSGLHSRRHEAGLRLNAAEANLTRLDDVAREIEAGLTRLRRDARRAEAYRRLSAQIRTLKAAALHARWVEAAQALAASEAEVAQAGARVAATTAAADQSERDAARATAELKPRREEAALAVAVLQRLEGERERLAREAAMAEAELARLAAEVKRNAADAAREGQTGADAVGVLQRLERERRQLEDAERGSPERTQALDRRAAEAAARRADADLAVENSAAASATQTARDQAARDRRAQAQAAVRTSDRRVAEAQARAGRLRAAMDQAQSSAAALRASAEHDGAPGLKAGLDQAAQALARARDRLAQTEAARDAALGAEASARDAARQADDALRRLKTEAQGLAQIAAASSGGSAYPPVLEQVRAPAGLEPAVAAALGEALNAALDARAPAYWTEQPPRPSPAWPPGVRPLAGVVEAPAALRPRLARTGLVARDRGAALQAGLAPGEALVSLEGDLWRWDGLVATAAAPKPAAQRLAQRTRLAQIERQLSELAPVAAAALDDHRAAVAGLRQVDAALGEARRAPPAAERTLLSAREAMDRHAQAAARRDARAQALAETLERDRVEAREAQTLLQAAQTEADAAADALAAADAELAAAPVADPAAAQEARRSAALAREAEAGARAECDTERRAHEGRLRRREALARDEDDWRRRADAADRRSESLEAERARLDEALQGARETPVGVAQSMDRLGAELGAAARRRAQATETLAVSEAAAITAERQARAAEADAAAAREARAAAVARLDGARDRLAASAQAVREGAGVEPQALAAQVAAEAVAIPADPAALNGHLRALERERDALGGVNLRAEEEAAEQGRRLAELRGEQVDLSDAIATLRTAIEALNAEGRGRLLSAFEEISKSFKALFATLFEGGEAELRLAESEDPLEAGLEIYACPPGKRLAVMSLMSGGEQALTAMALILAVFLAHPAPVCVLDEVDAPLDDANVDRFCRLLDEMRRRTDTRFIAITHNPVTMSRMDRLYGVTMVERGVSRLVSVDLLRAAEMAAA